MEGIGSILSLISGLLVSVAGIMTAIITIVKPLRKYFLKKVSRTELIATALKELEKKLCEKIETTSVKVQNLSTHVALLDKKIDTNEKDRLRDEIFRIGHFARKGEKISSQQFAQFEEDYDKYTALGGNSHAHDEHDFVVDYYNHKKWQNKE